ncbi:MAG: hypothetical protein JW969_21235 [Spirochaetales bacterium]|nr:hypothetical protein [Spirochaetales bacterium]
MANQGTGSIYELIEFAFKKIEEALDTDKKMAGSTTNYGLKKLLLSMIDQREEHKKQLSRLTKMGNLANFFNYSEEGKKGPADFYTDIIFYDSMEYLDFLTLLIKREEEAARLYAYLKNITNVADLKLLFQQLSDEQKKQRVWALDRYELEILCRDL